MFLLALDVLLVFVMVALLIGIGAMAGMETPGHVWQRLKASKDRLTAYWVKCRKCRAQR